MSKCQVCDERQATGWLCRCCAKSYDRVIAGDGTIGILVQWAAKRSRAFERRRARKERTLLTERFRARGGGRG